VNQNIFFGFIGYDKTKPFNAIKPLYVARLFSIFSLSSLTRIPTRKIYRAAIKEPFFDKKANNKKTSAQAKDPKNDRASASRVQSLYRPRRSHLFSSPDCAIMQSKRAI